MNIKLETYSRFTVFILFFMLFLSTNIMGSQSRVTIKLATLAPKGSPYHDVLLKIAERWQNASEGKVKLRIYAGGVAGSETDMLRKISIGQLHAASLSALGIMQIDPAYASLQVPGMISSYRELDYCRSKLAPVIEKRLAKKNFIVLNYGDVGFMYFFTVKKVTSIEELKKLKICTYATDRISKEIWKKAGFSVVDLSVNEVLVGLQTGLIEGFINSPVFALSLQWFSKAKYMTKVSYGIGLGATIVSHKQWNKINPELRKKLLKISMQTAEEMEKSYRALDKKALVEMEKYGLEIFEPKKEDVSKWIEPMLGVYPYIRKNLIPPEVFDKTIELRNEFRSKNVR